MNVYFLVEGKTERKVYPRWLSYLAPGLKRIDSPADAVENNYYLVSGNGYPSILKHLANSVSDINMHGKYNFLVFVIDTDNLTARRRIEKVNHFVLKNDLQLDECKLVIIPQVVCMETWFLGNQRIYSRNPGHGSSAFLEHYDASRSDPERMVKPMEYPGSIGSYHYQYLKAMLAEKGVNYTKKYPRDVTEPHYMGALQDRIKSDPDCLGSMRGLFEFFYSVTQET